MASVSYSYGALADSFTVIVADNDPISASIQLNGDVTGITVVFVPTPNPENKELSLVWKVENGVVHFTFFGWKNPLGTTTSQVNTHIGATRAGEPVYITISHHIVGEANHLTMQFIVGRRAGG